MSKGISWADPIAEKRIIPRPTLILDSSLAKVYFAPDSTFLTPTIGWEIDLRTPEVNPGDPVKMVLADLYSYCLTETMSSESYLAKLGGLNCDFTVADNAIRISIDGYSEKAPHLLNQIAKSIISLTPTPASFKIYKQLKSREYQNFAFEEPISQAFDGLKGIIYKNFS